MVDAHPAPSAYLPHNDSTAQPAPQLLPQPIPLSQTFSWNFVWNLFLSAPRTRSWLFQSQAPHTTHVVQSLLNSPVLMGFVFGAHISPQPCAFPDIGDLHTVFSRDDDTTLGFHFGFQGVHPIVPVLFQVTKDPFLANPLVIVRRTAKRVIPHANCILAIEFNWLASGALAVWTNVHPMPNSHTSHPSPTPYFEHAELRVFKRSTAQRFAAAVQLLDNNLHQSLNTPQLNDFVTDLFHPPDDYYSVIINEVSETTSALAPFQGESLVNFSHSAPQSFYAQSHILSPTGQCAPNNVTSHTPQTPPRTSAAEHQSQVASLWDSYQHQIAHSRTTGIFRSMISRKTGGALATFDRLFGRQAHYTLLCTTGINLKGRIHRLCKQIGIDCSSPRMDGLLLGNSLLGVRKRQLEQTGATALDDAHRVLDTAHSLSEGAFDWKRRKLFDAVTDERHVVDVSVEDALEIPPSLPLETASTGNAFSSASTGVDVESSVDGGSNGERTGSTTTKRQRTADSHLRMEDESALSPSSTPWLGCAASKPNIDTLVRQARERSLQLYSGQAGMEEKCGDAFVSSGEDLVNTGSVVGDEHFISGIIAVEDGREANGHMGVNANSRNEISVVVGTALKNSGASKSVEKEGKGGKGSTTIWTCDRCGVHIRGKKGNLNRHIANKHDNIRAYACKVESCGKRFQTRLNLVRHEKAVHQGRPFACRSCPRTFKLEKDLRGHVSTAHEGTDTELACEVCGSCFGRRSTLNRHLSKVHKILVRSHQAGH